jgi:hypothetical protein
MVIVVIACLVLAVFLIGRPPNGPSGSCVGTELQEYLLTMDRRQRQLRKDLLTKW